MNLKYEDLLKISKQKTGLIMLLEKEIKDKNKVIKDLKRQVKGLK